MDLKSTIGGEFLVRGVSRGTLACQKLNENQDKYITKRQKPTHKNYKQNPKRTPY